MKINYTGRHDAFPPKQRAKLEAKLQKIAKLVERRGEREAHVILTQERFLETLVTHGTPLLPVDTRWNEIAAQPETNPESLPFADSLVYITYTSGTTGRPKGILMTQRPLLNLLGWMLRTRTGLFEISRPWCVTW